MIERPSDDQPDTAPRGDQDGSVGTDRSSIGRSKVEQSPDAGNGAVGGTDGDTKNQDDTAQ